LLPLIKQRQKIKKTFDNKKDLISSGNASGQRKIRLRVKKKYPASVPASTLNRYGADIREQILQEQK
jgi:hypothetical protein